MEPKSMIESANIAFSQLAEDNESSGSSITFNKTITIRDYEAVMIVGHQLICKFNTQNTSKVEILMVLLV
jgi:hypothetical protein